MTRNRLRRYRWPDPIHQLIEYETACAYHDGYHQALTDLATRTDALDHTWQPTTRPNPATVIAQRAAALPGRTHNHPDHPGGPVPPW